MKKFLYLMAMLMMTGALQGQSRLDAKVDKKLIAGDTAKAIKILNKYIDKHPDEAAPYLKRARLKMDRNDVDPAMVDLNSFCSLNTVCGEAGLLKGIIRYRQQDYGTAIQHLSDYTKVYDTDETAWMYLALSHLQLGNYQVAANAFQKVLGQNPSQQSAAYNAGLAYYEAEEYAQAITYFAKATDLLPGDIRSWMGLALSKTAMGKHEEALADLDHLLELSPGNSAALYNVGVNQYHLDRFDAACQTWQKASSAGSGAADVAMEQYCGEK